MNKIWRWLVRVFAGPTNKFGFQCQFESGAALEYNRVLRPTHVMVINVTKHEFLEQLKAENPGVKLIYRHHPNYEWQQPTPEEAAQQAVRELQAEIGHLLDLLDYVTDNNEYILSKDHMAVENIQKGDRYMAEFIREARRVLRLGTCWANFNTGHWGEETVDYFPNALAAAEEDGDSSICFHEYNWPAIRDDGHWTCGKVLRAMPPILEKYNVPCMVTEFGVDDGGSPHKGWQDTHEDIDVAADMFCGPDGVQWYKWEVIEKAPWLRSVLFFGCGMVSPWQRFDVAPIIDRIKQALEVKPEEPNGGEEMDIRVIDLEYKERDLQYAKDKYGVAFRRAEAASGQKVYRLVELWEKTGTSGLGTQVLDENGQPMANMDVAFYWPDAPDPPDPPTTVYPHDWYRNFVHGPTNANGDIAPGMGKGAYHGKGEGGPHAVWVRDPSIPSDICEKLGMLAGTFHDHLDQKFKLMTAGEGPPSGNGGEGMFEQTSKTWQDDGTNRILLVPENHNLFEMYGNLRVGKSWEEYGWEIPDLVPPTEGDGGPRIIFDASYTPEEGETTRTFWAAVVDHRTGQIVGGPWSFSYQTGKLGWWTLTMRWTKEEEPEPEPPEPSEDPAQRLRELGDYVRDELYGVAAGLSSEVADGTLTLRMKSGNVQTFTVTPSVSALAIMPPTGGAGLLARAWARARGLVGR